MFMFLKMSPNVDSHFFDKYGSFWRDLQIIIEAVYLTSAMMFKNLITREFVWRLHYNSTYTSQYILEVDTLEAVSSLIIHDIGRTWCLVVINNG
jgi:hypothetical protein